MTVTELKAKLFELKKEAAYRCDCCGHWEKGAAYGRDVPLLADALCVAIDALGKVIHEPDLDYQSYIENAHDAVTKIDKLLCWEKQEVVK